MAGRAGPPRTDPRLRCSSSGSASTRTAPAGYATEIPAVRSLIEPIELDRRGSFFVVENGSGKSTLIEAIAVAGQVQPRWRREGDLARVLDAATAFRPSPGARPGTVAAQSRQTGSSCARSPRGLYILDEPEAAPSVRRQRALMRRMHELVGLESQFIVATHSPILLGYPHAAIFEFAERGVARVAYEETDPYRLMKGFLDDPEAFLSHLLAE